MSFAAADSLWSKTAPTAPSWPRLETELSVDVAVIGGGFTGVSAAYHAAARGASVALLEAREIGFGGSGRNVGLVNAGLWTPPDAVEAALGQEAGRRLNEALAAGPSLVFDLIETHQIRCEAVRNGTLHCAHSAAGLADLKSRLAQQRARGAPVALLSAEETRLRTGSAAYHGALWDGRAGTIQPLAYLRGLAKAAEANGARLFEASAAEEIVDARGSWLIRTAGGALRAGRLIQATNAYGAGAAADNSIIPAHYFQVATAPLTSGARREILEGAEGCWDTALVMSSFRVDAAGRLILGALGDLEGFGGGAHRAWARRKLASLFPALATIPFEHAWTGRIAMTSSHLPRLERRGESGVSIFGYSGRGIAPGTLFGRAAAEWATGAGAEALPLPLVAPHSERFAATKSLYFEAGAALTHLSSARS